MATGYDLGLIAIVVGLLVGGAVKFGSAGRGGWFYQTMAMVLTYATISASIVPEVVAQLMADENTLSADQPDRSTDAQPASAPASAPADASTGTAQTAPSDRAKASATTSPGRTKA